MSTIPWLCILIPTYENVPGIRRILNSVYRSRILDVEVNISDDSISNDVESFVFSHPLFLSGIVRYKKNIPSLGAVKNWNDLIESSNCKFYIVLHHDECPAKDDIYDGIKLLIHQNPSVDLIFLRACIDKPNLCKYSKHMPKWVLPFMLKFSPESLLILNAVGSPSNIVIRKTHSLLFNEQLKWFVDVDWVLRLLSQHKISWYVSDKLDMVSYYDSKTSITNTLKNDLPKIKLMEANLLRRRLGNHWVIKYLNPPNRMWSVIVKSGRVVRKIIHRVDMLFKRMC